MLVKYWEQEIFWECEDFTSDHKVIPEITEVIWVLESFSVKFGWMDISTNVFDNGFFIVLYRLAERIFPEVHTFEALGHSGIGTVDSYLIIIDQESGFGWVFRANIVWYVLQIQGVFFTFVCGLYIGLAGWFWWKFLTWGLLQYGSDTFYDDMTPYVSVFKQFQFCADLHWFSDLWYPGCVTVFYQFMAVCGQVWDIVCIDLYIVVVTERKNDVIMGYNT